RAVVACGRGAVAAPGITGARLFDLDHLGPELAQYGGREGGGDEGRYIEDPHARHRQGGVRGCCSGDIGRSLLAHRISRLRSCRISHTPPREIGEADGRRRRGESSPLQGSLEEKYAATIGCSGEISLYKAASLILRVELFSIGPAARPVSARS